jgi:hypothetical protein
MNAEDNIQADLRAIKSFLGRYPTQELEKYDAEFLLDFSIKVSKSLDWSVKQLKRLLQEKEKLIKRCEELEKINKSVNKYADYPRNRDLISKLQFILSKNGDPLPFDEIVAAFQLLEPDLNYFWRNPRKSISKIISRACKFGVIVRRKIFGSHGSFVYTIDKSEEAA